MEYKEVKFKIPRVGKFTTGASKMIAVVVAKTVGVGLAIVAEKLINFSDENKEEKGGEKNGNHSGQNHEA